MRNHFNGKLTVAVFGLFTFFALTVTSPASAQSDGYNTNSNLRGVVPFGTYQFGEIDNVNLASGTVNLRISLVSRQGRGSSEGLVFVYSSKIWVARPIPDPIYPDQFKWMAWEPTAELSHARVIESGTPGEL